MHKRKFPAEAVSLSMVGVYRFDLLLSLRQDQTLRAWLGESIDNSDEVKALNSSSSFVDSESSILTNNLSLLLRTVSNPLWT